MDQHLNINTSRYQQRCTYKARVDSTQNPSEDYGRVQADTSYCKIYKVLLLSIQLLSRSF